ncbi:MAG: BBP7 family outer membrane beta-barrel protein, partial [Gemmataceae bacterium]
MLIRWKKPLSALITASALTLTGTSQASDPQADQPTASKSETKGKLAPSATSAKEADTATKSSLRLPEPPPNKLIPEIVPLPEEGSKPAGEPSTEPKAVKENSSVPLKSLPAMPVSRGAGKATEASDSKETPADDTKQDIASLAVPEKPAPGAAPVSEIKPESKVESGPAPATSQTVTTAPATTSPTTTAPASASAPSSGGGTSFLAECLNSCNNCETKPECFWVSAEYLFWWVRSASLPFPLLTTSTPQGGPPGALDSSVLFGGGNVNGHNPYSGARIRIGSYSENLGLGFDVGGFFLEEKTTTYGLQSDAQSRPLLARPFYSVLDNSEAVNYISYPDSIAGGIDITYSTEVWGAEANFTR